MSSEAAPSLEDKAIASPAGGAVGGAPEGYGGHATFYVGVQDVEAALAKAEELGGSRMMGPMEVETGGVEIGQFTDLNGHVVGVVRPLAA